jgi:hypothetical protein
MIGFRWRVGTDWTAYYAMYKLGAFSSLRQMIAMGDPAYMALNWLAQRLGVEIWFVNLVCGSLFAWGLLRLSSAQPYPQIAMLIAIPYLVVVVAMGYARQAVAIGVLMAGLAHLSRTGSYGRLIAYTGIAGLFHKTAVVALPLAMIGSKKSRMLNFFIILSSTVLLFDFLLKSDVDRYVQAYVKVLYTSEGATTRIAMSVIPAVIFLFFQKRLGFSEIDRKIWRNYSLMAMGLAVALFIIPSSTVIDRLGLYVMPLQLVVFSRLPILLRNEAAAKVGMVLYSVAVLYVWLNYADNSGDWIPYRTNFSVERGA